MAWYPPIGRPPWTRVLACSTASSSTRCAPPTISAVRASDPAPQRRRQKRLAVPDGAEQVVGPNLYTVERDLEHLLAADRVERCQRDARAVRRHDDQARGHADAKGDDELIGDVGVLDEELAAAQSSRHVAPERERIEIERAAFFDERQRRDALAGGERREQALLLRRVSRRNNEGGRDHRAGDEGPG